MSHNDITTKFEKIDLNKHHHLITECLNTINEYKKTNSKVYTKIIFVTNSTSYYFEGEPQIIIPLLLGFESTIRMNNVLKVEQITTNHGIQGVGKIIETNYNDNSNKAVHERVKDVEENKDSIYCKNFLF